MTDNTEKPITMNSQTNITFHVNSVAIKNCEGIEVTDKQDNLKLNEELMSIRQPDKLQFDDNMTFEVTEPIKHEDTAMAIYESAQQDTLGEPAYEKSDKAENLIESAVLSQESLSQPTRDEIITVGHDTLNIGNQQFIPVTESFPNINVKLEENRVQKLVGSMKDAELKDLVNRELSKILIEEQQIKFGQPPLQGVKSDNIIEDEQNTNLENTLGDDKTDQNDINISEYYSEDGLSTLANAALSQLHHTNLSENSVILKPTEPVENVVEEEPAWCDVGIIMGTSCIVKQFYPTSITDEHENISLDNLTDYTNKIQADLEPGTAYKVRIAAINTCGRGDWSDIAVFKTCYPDYPSAPFAIKVKKLISGVQLTWEIPPLGSGNISEYTICMAISCKSKPGKDEKPSYNFARVYSGPHNVAQVSEESLGAALIDRTKTPAVIFRIAAKNEKGYGPATQVRWLQDSRSL